MSARAIMVLGCTSGAGKSWLATALCRLFARRGIKVAPFKAQNMSNHARVVAVRGSHAAADAGDGEIGSAQYFQALAAGTTPDVRMNPVLLKPESDTRSQVVVLGDVREDLGAMPWRERAPLLWEQARTAYDALAAEYELIVIEGAGSPAEINLAAVDFVNTQTALLSRAGCLLVADIDRGGAFAHLYGTHQLMDREVRAQLRGFILNRFRGDAALLSPGPEQLQALTGVPTVAVVPMMQDHGLPEEDAVPAGNPRGAGPRVLVISPPHASNLDEFEPLRGAGAQLLFTRDPAAIRADDWLVLPGSKQSRADFAWLARAGFIEPIRTHVAAGRPLLAICGGLQMLGRRLDDPHGLEGGAPGVDEGLGLLPVVTHFRSQKRLARVKARFAALSGPWRALSGLEVDGYEIHLGDSATTAAAADGNASAALLAAEASRVIGWQNGSVLGLYLHGIWENPAVLRALLGLEHRRKAVDFDGMADHVERHFTSGFLETLYES